MHGRIGDGDGLTSNSAVVEPGAGDQEVIGQDGAESAAVGEEKGSGDDSEVEAGPNPDEDE